MEILERREWINTCLAFVTAAAAVAIPVILHFEGAKSRLNDRIIAMNTRTIDTMDGLDQRIAKIVSEKIALDDKNGVEGPKRFDHAYIDNDMDVQRTVYGLLNTYEYICMGMNKGLFSADIIQDIRGDALKDTLKDYASYINAHRKAQPENANAWKSCDNWGP